MRGYTLEKLEELSGVEVGTLSALENRDSKRSAHVHLIAAALGVSVEDLMGEEREIGGPVAAPIRFRAIPPPEPTGLQAMEPAAPYLANPWPFAVKIDRVLRLPSYDIGRIDGYIQAIVEANENGNKSPAHA